RLWGPRPLEPLGRGDQSVTSAWHVEHVANAIDAITERFAQFGDMEAKAGLAHEDVGPDSVDQFLTANDLSRPISEGVQDIECPTAEPDDLVPSLELTLRGEKLIRSDRDRASRSQSGLSHHSVRPALTGSLASRQPV